MANTSRIYMQLNPTSSLIKIQNSTPPFTFVLRMFLAWRINCSNNSYPYLDFQAQLCYTACPASKYTNKATYRCIKCSLCTSISTCS